jgi:Ca2+-binding EF-hand superfamily protein
VFLACIADCEKLHAEERLHQAFDELDVEHTGFMARTELDDCLKECEDTTIRSIMKNANFNGDISKD